MDRLSRAILGGAAGYQGAPPGQQLFDTPGTYTWVAPAGVTSVSAVCVGAGGDRFGLFPIPGTRQGGNGGGLGWKNNIAVTPGTSYTVFVGSGIYEGDGQDSYFINTSTVKGEGGKANASTTLAGFVGDGGGFGGRAGATGISGGGGAGGYTGSGGAGGTGTTSPPSGVNSAGDGGGVWPFGQGANGVRGVGTTSQNRGVAGAGGGGGGGSGILNSATASGGTGSLGDGTTLSPVYGGGTRGYGSTSSSVGGNIGANGVVRIIWPGNERQFPSTNTADV